MTRYIISSLCITVCLCMLGCEESKNVKGENGYDRSALLADIADKVIIPDANAAATNAAYLEELIADLDGQELADNSALQTAWLETAKSIVSISAITFGPGERMQGPGVPAHQTGTLAENIAVFPVDTALIEALIQAQDTSLVNFDRDTRGIYAIEYFVFGTQNKRFSATRRAYLKAIVSDLVKATADYRDAWVQYRSYFIGNDGTNAGSSVSMLFNSLSKYYESAKNFKVALPLGLRPGQVSTVPELRESRFANRSIELLQEHLETSWRLYSGNKFIHEGENYQGFDDYLQTIPGGIDLLNQTTAQRRSVMQGYVEIQQSAITWVNAIEQHEQLAQAWHTELQKHTRFFKSDLSSLLGVAITYDSGDGD